METTEDQNNGFGSDVKRIWVLGNNFSIEHFTAKFSSQKLLQTSLLIE